MQVERPVQALRDVSIDSEKKSFAPWAKKQFEVRDQEGYLSSLRESVTLPSDHPKVAAAASRHKATPLPPVEVERPSRKVAVASAIPEPKPSAGNFWPVRSSVKAVDGAGNSYAQSLKTAKKLMQSYLQVPVRPEAARKALTTAVVAKMYTHTCFEGWAAIEKKVWDKLEPFETFMVNWFGEHFSKHRIEKTVLYHADANRVDICMRMEEFPSSKGSQGS